MVFCHASLTKQRFRRPDLDTRSTKHRLITSKYEKVTSQVYYIHQCRLAPSWVVLSFLLIGKNMCYQNRSTNFKHSVFCLHFANTSITITSFHTLFFYENEKCGAPRLRRFNCSRLSISKFQKNVNDPQYPVCHFF